MKRIKKALSLILAVVMTAATLVSCGTKTASGNKNTPGNTNSASDIKIADVQPTLKVLGGSSTTDYNDMIEAQVIEEATGYEIEYCGLPSENSSQALMLTLANDNDYDMVTLNQAQFKTLMSNHALLALNDYIDAIAPELWDCIPKEAWAGVSDSDGNVYAFPKLYTIDKEIVSGILVRMDLLEAAGITELPTTISGFSDMLYKLKSYYGNKYIILSGPYQLNGVGSYFSIPTAIMSAFGIYNDWMVDKDGNVIYMTEHENFDDMIDFLSQLYKDGIIDIDWASNGRKSVDEKFSSGQAIVAFNSREFLADISAALEDDGISSDKIGIISSLSADDGTCTIMETSNLAAFMAIPAKNPKNAADVVNYLKKRVENQEYIAIGKEGVHFYWDDDGYPVPIQPTFTDERNYMSKFMYFADMETYKTQFMARLKKNDMIWRFYETVTLKRIEENTVTFVPAYFAYCNSDEYVDSNTALQTSLNDYLKLLVVGQRTISANGAAFASDFKNAEGETIRKELQAWYEENYK